MVALTQSPGLEFPPPTAKWKLARMVVTRFALGAVLMGALLFATAGTFRYVNGWLFLAGLIVPMVVAVLVLFRKDPAFLARRMQMREREPAQRRYLALAVPLYVVSLAVPGLDFRFGWSQLPLWVSFAALVPMLGGYAMFVAVMNQNRYASRVVEIQEGQKLIDTGLYAVVRHPMYLSMVVLYLSAGLVLGSYWALLPMTAFLSTLVIRIRNEEQVLLGGLPGYADYVKRVRYRLIPLVW